MIPPSHRGAAGVGTMDLRKKNIILATAIAILALLLYVFAIYQVVMSKSAS